ncbi:MAG: WYL domain-containing protein [Thermoleophilaceae bacterium]|nr:WYL domain-containing protein [Thermoleophilaceae bacterium]
MAKDTEKLIRQLSLISFLMAKRRPVTALEIKRDVEGYSEMNDDAFARRFYADRAELEALGIELRVDRAVDGFYEAENYSLPPENFYLPSVQFTDRELASLTTALKMLDGRFAYAEPLRLALQQLTWGRPSPLSAPDETSIHIAVGPDVEGRELSQRLSKIENAIFRRKTILFEYKTITTGATEKRKVDPFHLLYRGGQFYMIGHSHERDEQRMFKLSRIQGKISYASKAEHDFPPPEDFDPREYATMAEWQFGQAPQSASIWISERVAWLVERHFSRAGSIRAPRRGEAVPGKGVIFETDFTESAPLISWVLGLGPRAQILQPAELAADVQERVARIATEHDGEFAIAPKIARRRGPAAGTGAASDSENSIRPERFARLITLAGILIGATHTGSTVSLSQLVIDLNVPKEEIEEDIEVLNVVNFGGGSYVLFAQIEDDEISVDSEPYSDNFARPARLLPLEAKALIAAIDLLGEYFPNDSLLTARRKVVTALGEDPATSGLQIAATQADDSEIATLVSQAIQGHLLVEIEHYKEDQDTFTKRTIEPYSLMNGREGWYVHSWDREREAPRDFRLDRIKTADVSNETFAVREGMMPDLDGWARSGTLSTGTSAKIWISPERAPRAREEYEPSLELKDGAILIDLPYGGVNWLVSEIFKFGADAVVLEPLEARDAVRDAAKALSAEIDGGGVKAASARPRPKGDARKKPVVAG